MSNKLQGDIDCWNPKGFGFLKHERKRIFFSAHNVEPDWKGSRAWSFYRGVPVTFRIEERVHEGQTKTHATDVAPLFPLSEPQDIYGYRETSEVLRHGHGYVFAKRPCGDVLFVHRNDVIQGFGDRWDLLEPGSPLFHGVAFNLESQRWRAAYIELYSQEELASFKCETQPEPAVAEPVPEAQPQPVPAVSVLAPECRRMTLLEIVQARRNAGHN